MTDPEPTAPVPVTLKRTTLIVRDAEASARWYERVLGLSRWFDRPFTLSGVGLAAGKAGDVTRLVILRGEDPVLGMIGLLQWVDPPLDAPAEVPTEVRFGMPIFVASTADAQGVYARALAAGTRVHAAPHEWSTPGADGVEKRFLGVSVFDPDGYFFEVNELLPPAEGQ